jgi:Fe-S cluster assembly scaffold protein SufB
MEITGAHTFPYIESKNQLQKIEHEATTSKIEDQVFIATNVEFQLKKQLP